MVSKNMEKALSDQVNKELASAYLYMAMSAHLEAQEYPGAAKWVRQQAREEVGHAMKLAEHAFDRGSRVVLEAMEKPPVEFGDLEKTFKAILEHEKKVTASIHKLYEVALNEKDYAAQVLVQWFITEQVEEEKTAQEIIRQLEAAEGRGHLLLMIDHRLGERGD